LGRRWMIRFPTESANSTRVRRMQQTAMIIGLMQIVRLVGITCPRWVCFAKGANKDTTGRVVVCREVGIGRAYTYEASYCGAHHTRFESDRRAEVCLASQERPVVPCKIVSFRVLTIELVACTCVR
jgi:hypothetical protein